jgi:hypothetical protein
MQTLYGLPELNGRTIFLFFKNAGRPNGSGCMLWTKSKHRGYGMLGFRGRPIPAHRFAWSLIHGKIPAGMVVCHKCDTPACCNVDHLFLGTSQDNLADMRAKGRQVRGSSHGNSKLTNSTAREAVRLCLSGVSQAEVGRLLGVNQTVISEVVRGITWSHATGLPKRARSSK